MTSRPRGLLMRAMIDRDDEATRALVRRLRDVVRRDLDPVSISMFEAQVLRELRRDDATRLLALALIVLGTTPAVTSASEKLRVARAVEDREWVAVNAFLLTLPAIVARRLRIEPNFEELVLEARAELCLCAPLQTLVTAATLRRATGASDHASAPSARE